MPHSHPSAWVDAIAWAALALALASALVISWDIFVRGYRHQEGLERGDVARRTIRTAPGSPHPRWSKAQVLYRPAPVVAIEDGHTEA